MILQKLSVHNFRNFTLKHIDCDPRLTILIGENARGKTNLLEAVYFVTNGTGFRETKEQELMRIGGEPRTSVSAVFINGAEPLQSSIFLEAENGHVKKTFTVNKAKKQSRQYLSQQTRSVLFAPEHIELLTGAPDIRRSYVNGVLKLLDLEYRKRVDAYEQGLRRRNKVLQKSDEILDLDAELAYWDSMLVEHATYISKKRQEYVDALHANPTLDDIQFSVHYVCNEFTKERLREYKELELKTRRTMIGPQKDDFIISIRDKSAHHFASRSEQRFTILWLKLNEIHLYEKQTGMKPILLLDDIFSEFDEHNKKRVLKLVERYQVVLTTTEEQIVEFAETEKVSVRI